MQLNRNGNSLLQFADKPLRLIRSQQSRHIFDADGVSASRLNPLRIINIILMRKDRTRGIGNCNLRMSPLLLRSLNCCLKVFDVIQRIKNTNNINTVGDGTLYKILKDIIGIVTIAQHILAAEQHLQLGVGAHLANGTQALPRILVEEAEAGVKRRAAPALQRIETDLIQLLKNGKHVLNRHSCRNQRLVRITQHGLGNPDFLCHNSSLSFSKSVETQGALSYWRETRAVPDSTLSPLLT